MAPELATSPSWGPQPAAGLIGSKAGGLRQLPHEWTPPWIVVRERTAETTDWVPLGESLDALLARAGDWLIVRSDGPNEARHPGAGRTTVIRAMATETERELRVTADSWPIVQAAVDPALLGVLSNERRVTAAPDQFVIEGALGLSGPEVVRIMPSAPPPAGPLRATSTAELRRQLEAVSGWLLRHRDAGQVRCEWCWDGERVWIVQHDQVRVPESNDGWLGKRAARARPIDVSSDRRWPKVRAMQEFTARGWPTAGVVVVDGVDGRGGRLRQACEAQGLEPRPARPLSLRADVRGERISALLPSAGPVTDWATVLRFAHDAARDFREQGVADDDWAVLVAPWLDARAAAWASMRPGDDVCHMDALWGHADGLGALTSDSYDVSLRSGAVTHRVRFKGSAFNAEPGSPSIVSLGPPWDWAAVLTDEQARRVAEWTSDLARDKGEPVQLLVLAGVSGWQDADDLVPLMTLPAVGSDSSMRFGPRRRVDRAVVSGPEDLLRLRGHIEPGGLLSLEPAPDRFRDVTFLRQVGEFAAARDLTVELHGSALGHPYYIITHAGARAVLASRPGVPACAMRTCLVRSSRGLSRVLTLPAERLTELVDAQMRAAGTRGERRAAERAHLASGRLARRLSELPVLDQDVTGALSDYQDRRGQPGLFLDA